MIDIVARGIGIKATDSISGITVGGAPYIQDGKWYVWDKNASSYVNSNIVAEGKDGSVPYIDKTSFHWFIDGQDTGVKSVGENGVGIVSISKVSQSENVDTYAITLSDGTKFNYDIINGLDGTNGVNGTNGENGTNGVNGINGIDGLDGSDGSDGFSPIITIETNSENEYVLKITTKDKVFLTENLKGAKGNKGDIGSQGAQGIQGDRGLQGVKGDQGVQGIQGERGADGMGGLNYKEYYSELVEYVKSDVVSFSNGNAYILYVESSTGNAPPEDPESQKNEFWERFVMRGSQGMQGAQGIQGIQGIQGEKGSDGLTTSVTVNNVTYNQTNGNIRIPDYPNDLNSLDNSISGFVSETKVASLIDLESQKRIEKDSELFGSINTHINKISNTQDGIHGLRYFDNKLSYYNGEKWFEIKTGGGGSGVPPMNIVNPKIITGDKKVIVSWGDPEDTIVEGKPISVWSGTKLVQKVGAYPENVTDGIVVVDNKVRNEYSTEGFVVNNLTNGVTYYFALFPYSDTNAVNENVENRLPPKTPQYFKVMTVKIDLTNSNPETSVTYADDAIGMTPKSEEWDKFFGHYPCLLKDGVEVGKLNRNDFTKFEDGSDADITSGEAGDVMIAFPRLGLKINTVGHIVSVSITENTDDDSGDFQYFAHTNDLKEIKDTFYYGAYKGSLVNSMKLKSLSGKSPSTNADISTFRIQARKNGDGYEQSRFYQVSYLQAMYTLKYKNLDSQSALGKGYCVGNNVAAKTGDTDQKGMDFGETTGKLQMKLFGIEDTWGNVFEYVDGIVMGSANDIGTSTSSFNNDGVHYIWNSGFAYINGGYTSVPQGTNTLCFLVKGVGGSTSTYFCDFAFLNIGVCVFGGYYSAGKDAGIFELVLGEKSSTSSIYYGGRLTYIN